MKGELQSYPLIERTFQHARVFRSALLGLLHYPRIPYDGADDDDGDDDDGDGDGDDGDEDEEACDHCG